MSSREALVVASLIRNTDDPALIEKKMKDHRKAVYQDRIAAKRREQVRQENLMAEQRFEDEKLSEYDRRHVADHL
jgi:hypothetical protein